MSKWGDIDYTPVQHGRGNPAVHSYHGNNSIPHDHTGREHHQTQVQVKDEVTTIDLEMVKDQEKQIEQIQVIIAVSYFLNAALINCYSM